MSIVWRIYLVGCDQMFCVKRNNIFMENWTNRKRVVHNPHAHAFFQNNPQLGEIYRNNINGNNGNGCRAHVPQFITIIEKIPHSMRNNIQFLHRTVSEFRAYYRNSYTEKIEGDITGTMNEDYRLQFLNKKIDENLNK